MNMLIISSVIVYLASAKVMGFSLASILSFVSTLLFCGRKVGYFSKLKSHLIMECIGLFLTLVTRLIFNKLSIGLTILYVILRAIFMFTVWYDNTVYVYVTEEEVKHDET